MIAALLTSPTIGAACEAAGVSRTTLARWLKLPLFTAELRLAESEAVNTAARGLLADLLANHATLRELRDNPKAPESIRLRAAVELDAAALRWRQAGDIETRLTALEAAVNK
jgi:hypothetical protein